MGLHEQLTVIDGLIVSNWGPEIERRRWTASRIEKVMGLNWAAYLERVWHE